MSLHNSTKNILLFYQLEMKDARLAIYYYIKREVFKAIKEAFNQIAEKERTQHNSDEYNKSINELNQAVELFAAMKERNDTLRARLDDEWDITLEQFTAKYTP
nr:hypothetical protein [Cytophagales bacterium]